MTQTITKHRVATIPPPSVPFTKASSVASVLSEDEASQARLFKVFADATRLRILHILSEHEGSLCVHELVEHFELGQPTISHHLRILRDAGVVDCRKRGLYAYYYLRRERLAHAQESIAALFAAFASQEDV